jgi:hypothetical protein
VFTLRTYRYIQFFTVFTSVADPDHFDAHPDPDPTSEKKPDPDLTSEKNRIRIRPCSI